MGLFTILMNNSTKELVVTNKIKLRQHDNLVDKLTFVVPFMYTDEIDLRDFNCVFEWYDNSRVAHVDILEKEETVYKDMYQRYFLPVTSPINRFAGINTGRLVFTMTDYETEKRYKLQTAEVEIPIETIADYFAIKPDESFDAINDMIDELSAKVDALSASADVFYSTKADDHVITEDGELYLTSNGQKIGTGLNVATPGEVDDDGKNDGILDLESIYQLVNL